MPNSTRPSRRSYARSDPPGGFSSPYEMKSRPVGTLATTPWMALPIWGTLIVCTRRLPSSIEYTYTAPPETTYS